MSREQDTYTRVTIMLLSSDHRDTERLHRGLQEDLRLLDDVAIDFAYVEPPSPGTKPGLAPIDWTTLFVTLASGGVLTALVKLVQSRVSQDRKVVLNIDGDKLEVSGISSEEQERLIDLWLNRHQRRQQAE
jgi:hypothetical protein